MSWISLSSEIKSITEGLWGSRVFEKGYLDRLINYSHSFENQPAASFFKNNNCCFSDQDSHKKRKDSLEGSLDQVLLAAELEFPKIAVPRLLPYTSSVKTLIVPENQNICIPYVASFLKHWYIFILLFWY